MLSHQVVTINGWPRHVRDLRRRIPAPLTPADKPPVAESSQEDEDVPLMVDVRMREEPQPPPEQTSGVPEESGEGRRIDETPVEESGSPPSIRTTPSSAPPRPTRNTRPPDWYGNRADVDLEDQGEVWC